MLWEAVVGASQWLKENRNHIFSTSSLDSRFKLRSSSFCLHGYNQWTDVGQGASVSQDPSKLAEAEHKIPSIIRICHVFNDEHEQDLFCAFGLWPKTPYQVSRNKSYGNMALIVFLIFPFPIPHSPFLGCGLGGPHRISHRTGPNWPINYWHSLSPHHSFLGL